MSIGKKITFSIILLVTLAIIAEVGARIVFKIANKDVEGMRLLSSDAGMKVEGRYVSNPFLPFALRPDSDHEIIWSPPDWPEKDTWKRAHGTSTRINGAFVVLKLPWISLPAPCAFCSSGDRLHTILIRTVRRGAQFWYERCKYAFSCYPVCVAGSSL